MMAFLQVKMQQQPFRAHEDCDIAVLKVSIQNTSVNTAYAVVLSIHCQYVCCCMLTIRHRVVQEGLKTVQHHVSRSSET